jgi:hypothetical protein
MNCLNGVTSQKIELFITNAAKASDAACEEQITSREYLLPVCYHNFVFSSIYKNELKFTWYFV